MMIQKQAVKLQAWRLGAGSSMERKLTEQGKITRTPDGAYSLHSQETRGLGQQAQAGDYFKVDSTGCPYPNDRAFFEANHRHLEGDWYLQQSLPRRAWVMEEPQPEEIRWLLETGRLTMNPENREACFGAFLWGAQLYAAADAIIVLGQVDKDETGKIRDVEFYFLARDEFRKTYVVCGKEQ